MRPLMLIDDVLEIYTDGSSAPRPRKRGVGFRMIFPDGEIKDFTPPGYEGATNNEMELQAAILALKEVLKLKDLKGSQIICVYTDSQYLIDNIGNARVRWPWNKWMRSNGEPVLNVNQWKELIRLKDRVYKQFHVTVVFEKVKAHSGHEHNSAVDNLAKASRRGPTSPFRISRNKLRKKTSEKKTVVGSIRGEGQRVRIRAISSSYLRQQRLHRARCEVLSKGSPYYGNVDFIISKEVLSAGHVYDVVLEKGLNFCSVKKIIKEVIKKD